MRLLFGCARHAPHSFAHTRQDEQEGPAFARQSVVCLPDLLEGLPAHPAPLRLSLFVRPSAGLVTTVALARLGQAETMDGFARFYPAYQGREPHP